MSSADLSNGVKKAEVFNYRSLSLGHRLRLGLRLYIAQYLGTKYSGYWHPSVEFRLSMIGEGGLTSSSDGRESAEPCSSLDSQGRAV